ncbi:MAG: response regulator [Woeseia sp.]
MSAAAVQKKRVLIVEDEAAAREASQRYLGFAGHEVATASDASEAYAKAEVSNPDVAICDWRLGGGPDGTEVARNLQEKYGTSIIFVTAHPLDELRDVTEDIRVTRYLRKPIQLPQLIEAIDSVR